MSINEQVPNIILDEIRKHYEFLFDRGYKVVHASEHNAQYGVWEVLLKNQEFEVGLFSERGYQEISFGSSSKGFVDIKHLVYYFSNGQEIVVGHLSDKKGADLLQKNIDNFENNLNINFPGEDKLKSIQVEYGDVISSSMLQSIKESPLLYIIIAIIAGFGVNLFYKIYNEAVFGDILSSFILRFGYRNSNWEIRGLSLLLSVISLYIIYRLSMRGEKDASQSEQEKKPPSLLWAIVFFPFFFIAFALLVGSFVSIFEWVEGYEIIGPIITIVISLLLSSGIVYLVHGNRRS
jgi:hypothetical protein